MKESELEDLIMNELSLDVSEFGREQGRPKIKGFKTIILWLFYGVMLGFFSFKRCG